MALGDARRCTATAKSTGERCTQPAVKGYNVCRLHGAGNANKGKRGGRPPVHGRYSKVHRESLAEKYEQHLGDPRPGDLTDELAMLRALLDDFLSERDRLTDEDYDRAAAMLEAIGRLVARISKVMNATALTAAEVAYLEARLKSLIAKYVDESKRQQFVAELRRAIETDR